MPEGGGRPDTQKVVQLSRGRRAVRAAMRGATLVRDPQAPQLGHDGGDGSPPNGGGSGGAGEETPRLIDLADEWNTALNFVSDEWTAEGYRTLNRYRGFFYHYDGSSHRPLEDEEVATLIWQKGAKSFNRGKGGNIERCRMSAKKKNGLLDAMRSAVQIPGDSELPFWLPGAPSGSPAHPERARDIWAVRNGLVHLPSCRLLPPTPAFFGLRPSPVMWLAAPPRPTRFLSFLQEAFGDDEQAVSTLRQAFGYSLSLDTGAQKIFALTGLPRTGKGTLLRVLTALVGEENVCAPTLSSLGERFGREGLIGKSVATIFDARLGPESGRAGIIQALLSISGEDQLAIERKFKPAWNGKLGTRLWLAANELPVLADTSNALAARMIVIRMNRSFAGREDPELFDRLAGELSGIAEWAVEGLIEQRERGRFVQPDSGRAALAGMRAVASETGDFVAECCKIEAGAEVESGELFEAYMRWRRGQALETRVSRPLFSKRLGEACPTVELDQRQRRRFGARVRFYLGVRLLRPDEDAGAV